jgi:hypothetical protein
MSISGRQLTKLSGVRHADIKAMERDGLLSRDAQGLFPLEPTVSVLLHYLRERLHLAERLCQRWCPGELDARWEARENQ